MCYGFIIGEYHSAAACSDGFIAIEGNSSNFSKSTQMLSLVVATHCFGSVFHYRDMIVFTNGYDFFYTAGVSEGVHWQAGFDAPTCLFVITRSVA